MIGVTIAICFINVIITIISIFSIIKSVKDIKKTNRMIKEMRDDNKVIEVSKNILKRSN